MHFVEKRMYTGQVNELRSTTSSAESLERRRSLEVREAVLHADVIGTRRYLDEMELLIGEGKGPTEAHRLARERLSLYMIDLLAERTQEIEAINARYREELDRLMGR